MIDTASLPPVLSVAQAARFLGIGRGLLYEAVHRNQVPSLRLGRRILIPRAALETWLAAAPQDGAGR